MGEDGPSLLMSLTAPSPMSLMAHSVFPVDPGYHSPKLSNLEQVPGSALGIRADREGKCFIKPTSKGKGHGDPSHRQSFEVKFQWRVALAAVAW